MLVGDFNFAAMGQEQRQQIEASLKTPNDQSNKVGGLGLKRSAFSDNSMRPKMHEEEVILRAGFEDIMHRFVEETAPTMFKTP